jgi:hypothetical protein
MRREFNVIIERDADGYFVASVHNLAGCHTQAKSLDDESSMLLLNKPWLAHMIQQVETEQVSGLEMWLF